MLAVGVGVLAISMVAFFRVPLLPAIGRDLSMSTTQLGVVTTAFAVGRLATDIPAGRLADRHSVAWMLAVAAVILAVGSLVLASASVSVVVIVAAFALGVSSATTNTAGLAYFSGSADVAQRGRATAGFSAALLGGQALGPALGGLLASLGSWRTAEAIASVIAAVIAAVIALRPRSAKPPASRRDVAMATPAVGETAHVGVGVPALERVVLYAVPFVMFFTLGSMPQTLVPIIGAADLDLTAAAIGLALGVGGVCRFAGAVIGGIVSDRVSRKAALVPGLLCQAGGVGLLALRGGVWVWVAAIVVMSLASFGISVAATMLADRSHRQRVGRDLGPFRFVGDIGLIVGPLVAAAIFEHVGQRAAVLTVAGLLAASALAAAFGLTETRWLARGPAPAGAATAAAAAPDPPGGRR